MAKVFLTPIDLSNLEIRNVLAQILASDPTNVEAKFYYNSADHTIHFYNGTAWLVLGRLDQISAPTTDVSLNSHKITNLLAPTTGTDAANQTYVLAQTVNTLTAPTTDFAMNSHKITGVTDPSGPQDAATKNYVDAYIQGIAWKESVRAATTVNGTLATAFANGQTVDGVVLATGNRILLKNQTTGQENGLYTVNAAGAPTRALDADTTADIEAASVLVEEGTSNAGTLWNLTTDTVTVGTTPQVWAQIGAGTLPTAGAGLTLTGSILDIVAASGSGIIVNADNIDIDPTSGLPVNRGGTGGITAATAKTNLGFMTRFAQSFGDGAATSYNIDHNLNTLDVHVSVHRVSDGVEVQCDVTRSTVNRVILAFAVAPTTNQYRTVIIG